MLYAPGYSITFTKKPPYIKLERKEIDRTYPVGSKVILNDLITNISEVFTINVRRTQCL